MSDRAVNGLAGDGGPRWRIDARRALRAAALASWAAFFAWLWLSGEMSRYLGPRTYWVIPFGAATLTLAAALHVMTLRTSLPQRIGRGDLVSAAMLVAPLVAVAIVPNADLGSLAASRKSTTGVSSAAAGLSVEGAEPVEDPSFRDIANAEQSAEYGAAIGVGAGTEVDLIGFVDEGPGPEGTFELTRFYVSCCAADAIPYSVAVDPPSGAEEPTRDEWFEASGVLEERDDRLVLVADRLEPAEEPEEPYLY